jgi:two-component system CheB/CheR fusion protein
MEKSIPTCIVGIGGSAGALNAYKALLDHLPADTGMAFVIISHMNPDAYSQLAQILARHTKMPALVASAAMPISANHVYVIPANADLLVENYKFKVTSPRSRRNAQIDLFFASISEAFADRAIGVVLSGYDGDGTVGCKHIKEKGGITFAQDQSAEVGSMPLRAQASGDVDFVLPPDKISAALIEIAARFAGSA